MRRQKSVESFVTVEFLLLALATAAGMSAADVLKQAGVAPQNPNAAINALRKGRKAVSASTEEDCDALKKTPTTSPKALATASSIR